MKLSLFSASSNVLLLGLLSAPFSSAVVDPDALGIKCSDIPEDEVEELNIERLITTVPSCVFACVTPAGIDVSSLLVNKTMPECEQMEALFECVMEGCETDAIKPTYCMLEQLEEESCRVETGVDLGAMPKCAEISEEDAEELNIDRLITTLPTCMFQCVTPSGIDVSALLVDRSLPECDNMQALFECALETCTTAAMRPVYCMAEELKEASCETDYTYAPTPTPQVKPVGVDEDALPLCRGELDDEEVEELNIQRLVQDMPACVFGCVGPSGLDVSALVMEEAVPECDPVEKLKTCAMAHCSTDDWRPIHCMAEQLVEEACTTGVDVTMMPTDCPEITEEDAEDMNIQRLIMELPACVFGCVGPSGIDVSALITSEELPNCDQFNRLVSCSMTQCTTSMFEPIFCLTDHMRDEACFDAGDGQHNADRNQDEVVYDQVHTIDAPGASGWGGGVARLAAALAVMLGVAQVL